MSISTRPYSSRLLTFLHRRWQKTGDRAAVAARRLQVAATWSLQAVVYPVYALVQSVRWAHQQLQHPSDARGALPVAGDPTSRPTKPASDLIPTVAGAARTDIDVESSAHSIETAGSDDLDRAVRAVASCMDSRQIVFVDASNGMVAGLTTDQQHRLLERIARSLDAASTSSAPPATRPLAPAPAKVLPLPRWLHWVQQGAIARWLNWFGESRLAVSGPSDKPPLALQQLDGALAQLEAAAGLASASGEALAPSGNPEAVDPFTIRALLRAAIEYFFHDRGRSRQPLSTTNAESASEELTLDAAAIPTETVPDPWLSWDDLYATASNTTELTATADKTTGSKPASLRARPASAGALPAEPGALAAPVTTVVQVATTPTSAAVTTTAPKAAAPTRGNRSQASTSDRDAPATLDAHASSAGYEPHFLERVLSLLDRLLIRLEALWTWLWNRLK
ncbi:hypothetical protein KR51_00022810 [Rubidibacter lacunae KORDI 51-2]|uniref:Uncharacterized protein n=1 Tax=Rubidibacter lacunae KORDI 51-2 TaxID=582515 RepID=U5D998_9CHRO|nr:hypothetical protein [Rubidibacter lacunae]ERN41153.1 hypothetical protein KR51_00022810 [Rubidibacter lacunae KORDI 51-2]